MVIRPWHMLPLCAAVLLAAQVQARQAADSAPEQRLSSSGAVTAIAAPALAAMSGVEPQLLSHMRVSLHQGLSHVQLDQFADVLAERVGPESAARARSALEQQPPANQ